MSTTFLKPGNLRILTLLVSIICYSSVSAQTLRTHVSTDSVSVGELFTYSISLKLDQEYETILLPDTSAFPPAIELIERKQFRVTEFSDSISYKFQYFDNEDLQIPAQTIQLYTNTDSVALQSEPLTLYFRNVVASGDTTLKPMQPNFAFPRAWWPWILAALLLAGFLFWWFVYREKHPETEPEPEKEIKPFYNPLEALEEKLDHVKDSSDIAVTKDYKEFYSEIGDAIRAYFEELYNIPALESTSRELLRYLEAFGVDDTLHEKTRIILRKADLVKFAKFTPTLDDAWSTYDEAVEFLKRAQDVDSARVRRLRAKYNAQFEPKPDQTQKRES
ncbi:MAG: hypothetical protein RI564_07460 [Gracilimonas sp.]|jgi:hypothetical protein|nr:hypothetical protein [Gracilimonas sp.]